MDQVTFLVLQFNQHTFASLSMQSRQHSHRSALLHRAVRRAKTSSVTAPSGLGAHQMRTEKPPWTR